MKKNLSILVVLVVIEILCDLTIAHSQSKEWALVKNLAVTFGEQRYGMRIKVWDTGSYTYSVSYIEGSDEDDFIGLQECNNEHSCWVLTFSEKMGTYCISLLRAGRFIKEFRVSESEGLDYGKQFIRDLYKAGILEDLPADKRGKLDGIEF